MSRCALITGANRGIGRETSLQLAGQAVNVIVTGRDLRACRQVADQIQTAGGHAQAKLLDLSQPDSIAAFVNDLREDIDILINNAGVFPDPDTRVFDADPQAVRQAMQLHLHAPLQLIRALVPGMQARGYGRVVNMTSGYASLNGMGAKLAAYRTSKAALNALTCVLAAEVEGNLKINAIDPGWVRTDMGGEQAPRSAAEAGADVAWAATLPADGPNGRLLRYREIVDW